MGTSPQHGPLCQRGPPAATPWGRWEPWLSTTLLSPLVSSCPHSSCRHLRYGRGFIKIIKTTTNTKKQKKAVAGGTPSSSHAPTLPMPPLDAQHREGAGRSPGLPSPPGCGGGQKGSSHSSLLPLGLPRRCPRAALPPQEAPSAVRFCDFLWLLAFGTDLPRPRDEAALRWCGGPAGRPHPHQHTSCFLQMLLRAAHVELRQR